MTRRGASLVNTPGVLAVALGLDARSDDSTREMGTAAVMFGLVALLFATGLVVHGVTVG